MFLVLASRAVGFASVVYGGQLLFGFVVHGIRGRLVGRQLERGIVGSWAPRWRGLGAAGALEKSRHGGVNDGKVERSAGQR